ncbi:GLE1-like [Macleaya cordata]|uniref:mRNA export factor GLE1 n=1 Tax=Macleaya cordata TaxID=56857 RepID=A0A200RCY7_MACCD|nr:GLE1-like [Macleaya cordata]
MTHHRQWDPPFFPPKNILKGFPTSIAVGRTQSHVSIGHHFCEVVGPNSPVVQIACRGVIKLELPCPKFVDGITADPEPNWNLDSLVSELNSLELKLHGSSTAPIVPFTKKQLREFPNMKGVNRSQRAFVMRVSDDEMEDMDSDDEEEIEDRRLVIGRRFSCAELYLSDSDSSEDDLALEESRIQLMGQVGLLDGVLSELDYEHQQGIKEEIRSKISLLETELMNANEMSTSALVKVEKYTKARRELDRKLDTQYCRKIAEALDNHLIAVQRNHEHRSQIEERRIRNDAAAFEEAKRKEKSLQEEKARQEKAKAEAEAARKRAEEAHKAALEAESRAAKEAAEREALESTKRVSGEVAEANAESLKEVKDRGEQKESGMNNLQPAGSMVRAAESALRIEAERLQKLKEFDERNQALRLSSNKDFRSYELQITRRIKQIAGNRENVRAKASELIKIINDPQCPQSISVAMFAKKVVSQCSTQSANFNSTAFACGHVIVLVTSRVPFAMDLLLAEFHRACIYTVPKHVVYSKSALSKEAYYKMMGYREEDGKIESPESYLEGVRSYMKLYGALVQTEINGIQNLHGLKEGWAWLARFLKALPANIYTAVALQAFLQMAGFALFRKYKSQFMKILNVISQHFLDALEARKDPKLNPVIMNIKTYINTKQFLQEPEGWQLQTSLLSEMCVPAEDHYYPQSNSYHQSNRYYR